MSKLEEEKILSNFEKVNKVKDYVENTHSLTIALDLIEKDQRIVELEKELHKYFVDNESLAEQLRIVREDNLYKEKELAELKEKAIVLDDFIGKVVYIPDIDFNTVIEQKCDYVEINLRNKKGYGYEIFGENDKKIVKVFKTQAEAEEALKKFENRNDKE